MNDMLLSKRASGLMLILYEHDKPLSYGEIKFIPEYWRSNDLNDILSELVKNKCIEGDKGGYRLTDEGIERVEERLMIPPSRQEIESAETEESVFDI